MKRVTASLLAALPVALSLHAERIEKQIPVTAGQKLELDLESGAAITIRGGSERAAAFTVDVEGRDAAECSVTIEPTRGGARIHSGCDIHRRVKSRDMGIHATVRVDVRVPRQFDVEIKSVGGGVTLEDLKGTFHGSTMGGALDLKDVEGDVKLSTMGGPVHVSRSRLDGKISTMGGDVLIEDVEGSLTGSSMGGKVVYRNVRRGNGDDGKAIVMSSMGGNLNVDDAPDGAEVSTMGGSVRIRSVANHVKASTMGGDVTIERADGSVVATSMGGDVSVTMVGDSARGKRDVKMESMSGELHLTVPADLAMDIDVELAYTRDSSRRYRIVSDFPLEITESRTWEAHRGSPRKTIHGTGRTGAGTHRIELRTINGDIYITRGR